MAKFHNDMCVPYKVILEKRALKLSETLSRCVRCEECIEGFEERYEKCEGSYEGYDEG